MSTTKQERDFVDDVAPSMLDKAIWWIAHNIEPGDVYAPAQLEAWAVANGFVAEE